jgi:cytochrome c-type biogenesis protein CcmH/NrfG
MPALAGASQADAYLQATALRPEDPRPWLNLGEARLSVSDEDAAEDAFRQAAAIAPGDARPYLSLGRLAVRRLRPNEAIELYYQAAAIDPECFDQV